MSRIRTREHTDNIKRIKWHPRSSEPKKKKNKTAASVCVCEGLLLKALKIYILSTSCKLNRKRISNQREKLKKKKRNIMDFEKFISWKKHWKVIIDTRSRNSILRLYGVSHFVVLMKSYEEFFFAVFYSLCASIHRKNAFAKARCT